MWRIGRIGGIRGSENRLRALFQFDRFPATPIVYIAGSLATTAIWVAVLFVALLALALYKALVA
jgi:hypothetical protein